MIEKSTPYFRRDIRQAVLVCQEPSGYHKRRFFSNGLKVG